MTVFIKHHIWKKTITVCVQLPLHRRMILRYRSIRNMGVSLGGEAQECHGLAGWWKAREGKWTESIVGRFKL